MFVFQHTCCPSYLRVFHGTDYIHIFTYHVCQITQIFSLQQLIPFGTVLSYSYPRSHYCHRKSFLFMVLLYVEELLL